MNINRRFGNNRRNFPRTSGAVRKPPGEPNQETDKRVVLQKLKKPLAIGAGTLLVAALGGLLLATFKAEPPASLPWQTCLTKWSDGTLYPDLLPVPTGEYLLSASAQELKPFLAPHGLSRIVVKDPFLLEKREVSVKAFRRYVAFVDRMAAGAEKERLLARIGLHWKKEDAENAPVRGISWEAAWDYADWMGQQTGCAYTLPAREQWGAAVLLLNDAQKATEKAQYLSDESQKTLLWGVREWTASPCAGGYYLVGEDDLVPLPEVRSATCMPAMLSIAGFRMAIKAAATAPSQEKASTHPPPAPAKP